MAADIALAYNNLSTLLAAGVPMLRSLNTTASGFKADMKRTFLELGDAVAKGIPMAEGMARHPRIFDPLDVMIIRAAEASGSLPESLKLLAQWHEFCHRIKKRTLSGLMLPIALIHLTAVVAPLPSYFLGGQQLDSYIRSVIMILSLFYIPAAIVLVITGLTPKEGMLRRMLDRVAMRIPLLHQALYKLSLSRYCWVFHMLTKAGLPMTDCAEKAAAATGNAVVRDMVKGGASSARAGNPVSAGLSPKLPPEFINIWLVGEETGELDNVTRRLAENTGESAELLFRELAAWFPRLIYVLVSILIIYYIFQNLGIIYSSVL